MSYPKSVRRKEPPAYAKEIHGILLFAVGFFLSLILFSYHASDPGLNTAAKNGTIANLGGVVGAYLADFLLTSLGLCAFVSCALAFLLSAYKFKGKVIEIRWKETIYYGLLMISFATLLQITFPTIRFGGQTFAGGGVIGALLGQLLIDYLNPIGAKIVTVTACVLTFIYATQLKVSVLAVQTWRLLVFFGAILGQHSRVWFERSKKILHTFGIWLKGQFISMFGRMKEAPEPKISRGEAPDNVVPLKKKPALAPVQTEATGSPSAANSPAGAEPKIFERMDQKKPAQKESQLQFSQIRIAGFALPSPSLLDANPPATATVNEEALKKNAMLLEKKLLDFQVEGRVTEIHPGPVITMYEFEPSAGVKVNKVVNLEDDLGLIMGGKSVRIVPHLPGKAALGIEIPNHERETVRLREIVASPAFQHSKSKLTLALGKDTEGKPVVTDLARMPHLLIAGATGSGKSVAIHSMIVSMLYKSSPEEVRFIFVDPKRLELNVYDGIPHLLLPVVTQPKQAVAALNWAKREMERRYKLLAEVGARDIKSYNEKIAKGEVQCVTEEEAKKHAETVPDAVFHTGKLSYIVIIIDELADMMMIASQEFEDTITRLAQMARASGIHMILATQRPSVDVITGLIKANFPTRISLKVSARHDSRTILDQIGAESLLGNGDMLFIPPNISNLTRIHGALITEQEIGRVASFLKEQAKPNYNLQMLEEPESNLPDGEEFDEEDDKVYDTAVKLVSETRQASISMIQRRLRIGFNRAARMIERMEKEGVIGPQVGAKPREVFVQNTKAE